MSINLSEELLSFLQKSPTAFHAVYNVKNELEQNGYQEVMENQTWNLKPNGKYFVTRNQSSIIAFSIPANPAKGFMIGASHSDSPVLKIKENPEIIEQGYVKLNVEKYGGMLCAPWFDRPLTIAGRVVVKQGNQFVTKLLHIDDNVLMIPNLAIHMNRTANESNAINVQTHMLPIFASKGEKGMFLSYIAKQLNVNKEDILSHDLFLTVREKGVFWGMEHEYISSPRIDDLACGFANMKALLNAQPKSHISVVAIFDNEETGSLSKQGADSTFLYDTLQRICNSLQQEDYHIMLSNSFMVSADNGHALHPNYREKADPINQPLMNQGIVIKYNANQKYTSDAVSSAIFKDLCNACNVPYQTYTNRSDIAGGSTLGNIANSHVSLNTVDIGLAQLAMHSCFETAGAHDLQALVTVMQSFFSKGFFCEKDGTYHLD